MSQSYRITLLPGDGIGPEIIAVAVDVLKVIGEQLEIGFEFQEALIGGAAIDATGEPLPAKTLEICRNSNAVLLAAIGGYKWDSLPRHLRPETGLLGLRAGLGLFANLRPAAILPQLIDSSTLKREVVEGAEIDRIGRVAFETAQKRRKKLCSVDKANVLEVSQLWRDRIIQLASEYPDVELSHLYVDNAAMQLLRAPKQFDTIVTGNLFGDILSDAAAMLTGSIGMLPSASLGENNPGVFEPVHGSAPDIAGQDKANPLAQVLSAAMMLRYGLNQPTAADRIEQAVLAVLDQGDRTGDIMSEGMNPRGCRAMGDALIQALSG